MSNSPYAQLQIKDHGVYQARAGGRRPGGQEKGLEGQGWLEGWATVEGRNLPIHTYKDFTASTSPETFDLFKTIRLHMLKI